MLMKSHQVPAATQAVPNAMPASAAARGVAPARRQASSAMQASCSGQAAGSKQASVCSAPSAAASSTSGIRRRSVASDGTQANGASGFVGGNFRGLGVSNDGRFVTYASDATNLVANDTNATTDVFLRDTRRTPPPG